MGIKISTPKEEATELLTALLAKKGIDIDAVEIEIFVTIINLFVKAYFQEGAEKLRTLTLSADSAKDTPV